MKVSLLLVSVLLLPTALAGGVDTPLVSVRYENGQSSCFENATGLCLGSVHGGTTGETVVDVNQQVSYVAVALNGSHVNEAAGADIVPDRTIERDVAGTRVWNPAFRLLDENVGSQEVDGADTGTYFGPTGWGIYWFGPALGNFSDGPGRNWLFAHRYSGGAGFGYEHISPYHRLIDADTDGQVRLATRLPCLIDRDDDCGLAPPLLAAYQNATPNVVFGLDLDRAAAGTDPSALNEGAIPMREGPSAPVGPRDAVLPPAALSAPATPRVSLPGPHADAASPSPGDPPRAGGRSDPPPSSARLPPPDRPGGAPVSPLIVAGVAILITLAVAALYHRVAQREETLVRARRAEILRVLEERGPLPLAEVARAISVDRTTVSYHAQMLARGGRLRIERAGGSSLLALPSHPSRARPPVSGTAERVLELLREHGPLARGGSRSSRRGSRRGRSTMRFARSSRRGSWSACTAWGSRRSGSSSATGRRAPLDIHALARSAKPRGGPRRRVRQALVVTLALALLAVGPAFAHPHASVTRGYVGATVRDPLFGPVVVCDADGNGVGGVCFEAPYARGWVTIIVHDDHAPDWAHVPIMIYGYGDDIVPLPIDGEVECPVNHGAVKFWFQRWTERIVVGIGPWIGPGITCPGVTGGQGTVEMVPWIEFPS